MKKFKVYDYSKLFKIFYRKKSFIVLFEDICFKEKHYNFYFRSKKILKKNVLNDKSFF